MRKNCTWILFMALIGYNESHAQTDCSQALIQAERAYYTGRFNEVSESLAACLASGFSKEQRIEAYRLMGLSFIFSRNSVKADSVLRLLLKIAPQYEKRPDDPPEFIRAIEKFKVFPRTGFILGAGLIQPFFRVDEVFNVRNIPSRLEYKGSIGQMLSVGYGWYLKQHVVLNAWTEMQRVSFSVNNKDARVETELSERQVRAQLMVASGYNIKRNNLSFQVLGGLSLNQLLSARADLQKSEDVPGFDQTITSRETNFSNLTHRAKSDLRPLIMVHVGWYQKKNYIINLFARYEWGLLNMTANRESNPALAIKYEWLEDNFKSSYFTVGINYTKLKYKIQ